eukprot:TRINITY_DN954_c0_g1_i2.p1 TRINITY_DN954_c0_g1~~TRINITY_DN954_c0_g1_i2.p1  ORF type:complete len:649 (-),score=91.36 TRINITY_DN954_c0_g1_i2:93-2039(-)
MFVLKACALWAIIFFSLVHLVATTKNGQASNLYPAGDPIAVVGVMSTGQLQQAFNIPAPMFATFSSDIIGHIKSGLYYVFPLFSTRMRLALAQLPQTMTCAASCANSECVTTPLTNYVSNCANDGVCGSCSGNCSLTRQAAHVVVPAPTSETTPSNHASLMSYVDGQCSSGANELHAWGDCQPFNGLLRGMTSYLLGTYVDPISGTTLTSPLADAPACKPVHINLIYAWSNIASLCDTESFFIDQITQLSTTGITFNGKTFKVVVSLYSYYSSGTLSQRDMNWQAAGATVYQWNSDTVLATSLTNTWLAASVPDTCNNLDDDCDGAVDEDYTHYCNLRTDCCAWNTTAQRTTCLNQFVSSISPANPRGNVARLPCTTGTQSEQSSTWLCYNPGEQCNGVDDNCDGQIDEGFVRCGSPLHCPRTEVCNGLDDDCNGLVDDGVNCNGCVPSREVCDGCDNDCNGLVDDFPAINVTACGSPTPTWCQGQMSCQAPVSVTPGGCVAGRGWTACNNSPQTETCNDQDDDCNGLIDDNVAPTDCEPQNAPAGLIFTGASQCKRGHQFCGSTACVGFVGPTVEVCDGIDNDCNGQVDDNLSQVGQSCGRCVGQGPCTAGTTACVEGVLVCQNEVTPQTETLNGIDDNCNAIIDDA